MQLKQPLTLQQLQLHHSSATKSTSKPTHLNSPLQLYLQLTPVLQVNWLDLFTCSTLRVPDVGSSVCQCICSLTRLKTLGGGSLHLQLVQMHTHIKIIFRQQINCLDKKINKSQSLLPGLLPLSFFNINNSWHFLRTPPISSADLHFPLWVTNLG